MKIVAYLRVSTEEQAAKGISLDAQEAKCIQWMQLHDAELIVIKNDAGVSGKAMNNRPGLLEAIKAVIEMKEICGDEPVVLLVYSLSRLSRSVKDTIMLIEKLTAAGVEFVSIVEQFDTTTAMGRAFMKIIAVLSELEREQTVERTNAIIAHKRTNGEAVGPAPYGFRSVKEHEDDAAVLEPNPDEKTGLDIILAAIKAADRKGEQVRYGALAQKLDDSCLAPRSGGTWDRGVLRRIVLFYRSGNGVKLLKRFTRDGQL